MILALHIGIFVVFAVASIIDLKFKWLPSFLLTTVLFVVSFIMILSGGIAQLEYGFIAFVFALLLFDINYFRGWGDIKAITIMGFLVGSFYGLMGFFITFLFISVIYSLIYRHFVDKEVPMIPSIFITYTLILIMNLIF